MSETGLIEMKDALNKVRSSLFDILVDLDPCHTAGNMICSAAFHIGMSVREVQNLISMYRETSHE